MNALVRAIESNIRLRPRTRDLYSKAVRMFVDFTGNQQPSSYTTAAVEAWRDRMLADGLDPATINGRIFALRSASRRYADLGGSEFAKAAQLLPVTQERNRRALSHDEARRLVGACSGDRPADLRDRAIITLALRTGCRREGIAQIDAADYQRLVLTVNLKGGRRHTLPPLDSETQTAIDGWIAWLRRCGITSGRMFRAIRSAPDLRGRWVVGGSLSGNAIYRIMCRRAAQAGVDGMYPHRCRHYFVSTARSTGWPDWYIAQYTGHASVGTLGSTYPMLDQYTSIVDAPAVAPLPSLSA
ncbi:MAG: site-specific integrase [Pseudomonadota bacterium]